MEKAIRILYVENISSDAELVLHEISKSGIQFIHSIVETKSNYTKSLISFIPDLIISDYALPNFDGMNALSLRNEIAPQTPFILVTGSINKELAAECIKAGADDYVLKTDLKKLTNSITKAFARRDKELLRLHAESDIHNKRAQIETSKHFSFPGNPESYAVEDDTKDYELIEEKLTLLSMALKSAGIGTWVFDIRGNKGYFDKKARQLLGLTKGVFKSTEEEFLNCIHPDDRKEVKTLLLMSMRKKSNFELEFRVSCDNEQVRFLTARVELVLTPSGDPLRLNGFV
jgi:CheY-like chemotaxis protein